MMTWMNKRRTLVLQRQKGKYESEKRLYTIMKLVVTKRKERVPTRKKSRKPKMAMKINEKMIKKIRLLCQMK